MPVHPDDDPAFSLLLSDDGIPLARFRFENEDTPPGAADFRHTGKATLSDVVAQARQDLAGMRLDTEDEALVDLLVADGLTVRRIALEMRRELTEPPAPAELPIGWSLGAPGWDDDLRDALVAAYGPDHPALRGAHEAGLTAVELGVAEGNAARRMYESAGFRPTRRVFSIRL